MQFMQTTEPYILKIFTLLTQAAFQNPTSSKPTFFPLSRPISLSSNIGISKIQNETPWFQANQTNKKTQTTSTDDTQIPRPDLRFVNSEAKQGKGTRAQTKRHLFFRPTPDGSRQVV
jgi:hypothetical protein